MQQLRRPLTTAIGVAITRRYSAATTQLVSDLEGRCSYPLRALQCMDEPVVPAEATKGGAADHGVKRSGIQLHQLT